MVQQWHFFLLAPFCNLRGFVKHDNILRNMNFGNHLNETNVAISLRVGVANHLKLVRIYLRNPVRAGVESATAGRPLGRSGRRLY